MSATPLADALGATLNKFRGQTPTANADRIARRDKQADELTDAIKGIQARTDLSPDEKSFQIGEAQKQLTALYQPHEAPALFDRIGNIFGHGKSAATPAAPQSTVVPGAPQLDLKGSAIPVGIPGAPEIPAGKGGTTIPAAAPTQVTLKPGMRVEDILAAGSPQAAPEKPIHSQLGEGDDGKTYLWSFYPSGKISKTEAPGYGEKSEFEKISDTYSKLFPGKHLTEEDFKVKMGLESKEGTGKQVMPVIEQGALVGMKDPATNELYTDRAKMPPEMQKQYDDIAGKLKDKEDEKQAAEDRRFQHSLDRQTQALQNALTRNDYVAARREVNTAQRDLDAGVDRMRTMDDNMRRIQDAAKHHKVDQQAMLSLTANHIGMTLGAQKGARITRAVWDEAMGSAPWLQRVEVTWSGEGADALLLGAKLTADQMIQMNNLAHDKVDVLKQHVQDVKTNYSDALGAREDTVGGKPANKEKPDVAFKVPPGAPPASGYADGFKLKMNGQVIAVARGGQWVSPSSK